MAQQTLNNLESGLVIRGKINSNFTDLYTNKSDVGHSHTVSDITDAGSAATYNVPAAGDAAAGEVVLGNDSRLTDSRTPTAHTHTKSEITDFTHTHTLSEITDSGTAASYDVPAAGDAAAGEVVKGDDSRLTDSRTPTAHNHAIGDVTNLQTNLDARPESAVDESITGLWNFKKSGLGDLTEIDMTIGTVANYGMAQIGSAKFGRTSHTTSDGAPLYNLDGAFVFENSDGPVTGDIEFGFLDSSGLLRFGIPSSAVGNGTYNPRSMIIAGPAIADSDVVTVGYWQSQGIFHNLTMNTGVNGADLGVQNDLEVEGDIFTDSIKGSTDNTDITLDPHGTGEVNVVGNIAVSGTVDGRDVATDGTKLDGIADNANNYTHPTYSFSETALTGAAVVSNLTTTNGHVTGWSTRNLTPANIGAAASSHTHTLSEITDSGTAAGYDVPAAGDAAAGEVVKGDDSRLTDSRTPTAHTHVASEITDFDTEVANNSAVTANTAKLTANTTNVTNAGALMDSEVTNLAAVKAFDPTDYASSGHTHAYSEITGTLPNDDLDLDSLTEKAGALVGGDRLILVSGTAHHAETINQIPLSIFNNDLPAASVENSAITLTAGKGIGGGGVFTVNQSAAEEITFTSALSELDDMTAAVARTEDELILLDNGLDRRKLISEINLSDFNDDLDYAASSHTHVAANITDFDTEVANNSAVTANTAKVSATTANITSAGALMDSEVTNLADVKAFDPTDYASSGHNHTLDSLSNVTITTIASGELLTWNGSAWINETLAEAGIAATGHTHIASNITDFDTAVSGNSAVSANTAKVSATTVNIQSAGALMDSEVTNLAAVKAFDPTDYATSGHTHTASEITDFDTEVSNNASVVANTAKVSATTANIQSAGALMDSEVTNLAQVKAFDSSDYATSGHTHALNNISDVTITSVASGEVLGYNGGWINRTLAEAGIAAASHNHTASQITDFDTEVSNNSSVTANTAKVSCTTANVTSAGALMDSEVTNLADVKAFNPADYATSGHSHAYTEITGTIPSADLPDLTVADFAGAAIQTGAEGFADSDTVLMTAAAVQDKIESYNYASGTFDNYSGWLLRTDVTERGTVASGEKVSFVGGTGIDISYATTNDNQLTFVADLSEFTEITLSTTLVGTDQLIVLDGGAERKIDFANTKLSLFNDDLDYAASSHTHTASQITDFDTEVSNNTSVAANTAKVSNVTTNISITETTTSVTVVSSDGSNGVIAEASGTQAGVMTVAHHDKLDGIAANANNYTHPSYSFSQTTLSGATVVSNLTDTGGHVTGWSTRELTAADIGAIGLSTLQDNSTELTLSGLNLGNTTVNTSDSLLHIKQTSDDDHGGIKITQLGSDETWSIFQNNVNDLLFAFSSTADGAPAAQITFDQSADELYINGHIYASGEISCSGDLMVHDTGSPDSALHIKQPSNDDHGGIKITQQTTDETWSFYQNGSNDLIFGYASTATTTPSTKFWWDDSASRFIVEGNLEITGHSFQDSIVSHPSAGTTETITWTAGNMQMMELSANCAVSFVSPSGPTTLVLAVYQNGTGGYNVTSWPANVKWPGGTAPTISSAANAIDVITFFWSGTTYYGGISQDFS